MKLGILSDTHNHVNNTRRALEIFREREVTRLIHCGDISTPGIIELFEGFKITFVFGNIDQFHADLMEASKKLFGIGSIGYHYTAIIEEKLIAVCHGDDEGVLRGFIEQGVYDYVFHGHTHRRSDQMMGRTRVINPGALGGRKPEPRRLETVLETESGLASS